MPDQTALAPTLEAAVQPIPALLSASARNFAKSPAIDFMGRVWTYAELDHLVDRATAGLQKLGVVHGTRVGCACRTRPMR
ncbi:MAG: AMP-binding protein [Rhodospirillales bacterium]